MPIIYIDNKPHEVRGGQNLLQACVSLGFDLPYFCWHPALHAVGACRQCAVKVFAGEQDARGKIVMACMTPVRDGVRLSIDDPEARAFRAGVIELLMANHPHDCPVCDEGGECHLQDMTVMTGHVYRTHRFAKRTHRNQNLGPFVNHEMNRCIACYRCVRFYRDFAGGDDLDVFSWHDAVYFGRKEDGRLESEFSGNLVEVCPTGVFTDKTFRRHYSRKWDLQTAPSVCMHCSLGCNTIPAERYGTVRRISNRYNYDVNGYFLCDRGRFGYGFVNGAQRLRSALARQSGDGPLSPLPADEAFRRASTMLREASGIIGIGSPRASLETNFTLAALAGPGGYCNGLSRSAAALMGAAVAAIRTSPLRQASMRDAAAADAVFVLGEDLLNTAPMLGFALRQAMVRRDNEAVKRLGIEPWDDKAVRRAVGGVRTPMFIATPAGTRLDRDATAIFRAVPDDLARLVLLTARALDPAMPQFDGRPEELAMAERIAAALAAAKRPLIVWGTSCRSSVLVEAASALCRALYTRVGAAQTAAVLPECNSLGAALFPAIDLDTCLESLQRGQADTLVIVENDLFRRYDEEATMRLLGAARQVIVIDHLRHRTAEAATLALPAATFAEATGTVVNSEGRAQRFYKVFVPEGDIRESWRWLRDLIVGAGMPAADVFRDYDAVVDALSRSSDVFAPVRDVGPPADFRIEGQKVPRQPHRYSGRTAMCAARSVFDAPSPADPDSPFAFSMEGSRQLPPPSLVGRYWKPGWNSVQAVTDYQTEAGGPLRGGESGKRLFEPVAESVAPAPAQQPVPPFVRRPDEWLVVPLYHIFGSEELSSLAPAIAGLIPKPYLALCPADATTLGLADGDTVEAVAGAERLLFPVKLMAGVPEGAAGMPQGIAYNGEGPQWITIRKAEAHHE